MASQRELERTYSRANCFGSSPPSNPSHQADFRTKVAHLYDGQSERKPTVLLDNSGRVIGGTGGNARSATISEIYDVLHGGAHQPTDQQWLRKEPQTRRTKRQTFKPECNPEEPMSVAETNRRALEADRAARRKTARQQRDQGNGQRPRRRQVPGAFGNDRQ